MGVETFGAAAYYKIIAVKIIDHGLPECYNLCILSSPK